MLSIILHVMNEDPIVGEIDEVPTPQDTVIVVKNPRQKQGGDVHYIDSRANIVVWPMSRVNFIEIISDEKTEEIISFVRE